MYTWTECTFKKRTDVAFAFSAKKTKQIAIFTSYIYIYAREAAICETS